MNSKEALGEALPHLKNPIFDRHSGAYHEAPTNVVKFLDEYTELCRKHGLVIEGENESSDLAIRELAVKGQELDVWLSSWAFPE